MGRQLIKKKYRDFDDMLKTFNASNELNKPSKEEVERQRNIINEKLDSFDMGLRVIKSCDCNK